MLPLYYSEFEWRFNHRNCKSIMDKIKNYIMQSSIATRKMIRDSMDQYATARGLENAWGCQMGNHILFLNLVNNESIVSVPDIYSLLLNDE